MGLPHLDYRDKTPLLSFKISKFIFKGDYKVCPNN